MLNPKIVTRGSVISLVLWLAACKTWYKPGAEGEDFDQAQLHCEEQTGSSEGKQFLQCMQQSGWTQSRFSASIENDTAVPDASLSAPATSEVPSESAAATSPRASTLPERHQQPGNNAADTKTGTSPHPASIIGWYQFGADEDELDEDRTVCEHETGSHGAFIHCMKRRGWKPMGGQITTGE